MTTFNFKCLGALPGALRATMLAFLAALSMTAFAQSINVGLPQGQPVVLRLQDFFQMPVGAQGLVISERLRRAQGMVVRLTGYVVQQEVATLGQFLLTAGETVRGLPMIGPLRRRWTAIQSESLGSRRSGMLLQANLQQSIATVGQLLDKATSFL